MNLPHSSDCDCDCITTSPKQQHVSKVINYYKSITLKYIIKMEEGGPRDPSVHPKVLENENPAMLTSGFGTGTYQISYFIAHPFF